MSKKSKIEEFNNYTNDLISLIPEKYNKAEMLKEINNPDIDLMMSITTRGDGKTFSYFGTLLQLADKFHDFKLLIISRHYTLRDAYVNQLEDILTQLNYDGSKGDFVFMRTDDYIELYLHNESVAIITDLNNATDLKYHSGKLKHYRFIVYDEFLAIEGDYIPDEIDRLKTIYESVDRGNNYTFLDNPKILLLGNPVNFSSPLLSYWGMFDMLEKQKMNTIRQFGHFLIERRKNDNINEEKNNRLFSNIDNNSITGEFKINKELIAGDSLKSLMKYELRVKLEDLNTLVVHFNDEREFYLQIDGVPNNNYQFCIKLRDYKSGVRIVSPENNYFSEFYAQKYIKHKIYFSDMYSLNYIDDSEFLKQLKINKLISKYINDNNLLKSNYKKVDFNEQLFEKTRQDNIKRRLFKDYELNL